MPPGQSVGGPHSKPHGDPAWHPLPRTHSIDRLILGLAVHAPLAHLVLGRPGAHMSRSAYIRILIGPTQLETPTRSFEIKNNCQWQL